MAKSTIHQSKCFQMFFISPILQNSLPQDALIFQLRLRVGHFVESDNWLAAISSIHWKILPGVTIFRPSEISSSFIPKGGCRMSEGAIE
nr:hypothetical protein Iba_chr07dCG10760 [Ipomoea batatas]